jgi:hypothetical protein
MDELFPKPVDINRLIQALIELLNSHQVPLVRKQKRHVDDMPLFFSAACQ